MYYVKALAREPLVHRMDLRRRTAKAPVEFRWCQPLMVVWRSRILQLREQFVERGPIANRERNVDRERKVCGRMRREPRCLDRMVAMDRRAALCCRYLRHKHRRGRDKRRTQENMSNTVVDPFLRVSVSVRFRFVHASTPFFGIGIANLEDDSVEVWFFISRHYIACL